MKCVRIATVGAFALAALTAVPALAQTSLLVEDSFVGRWTLLEPYPSGDNIQWNIEFRNDGILSWSNECQELQFQVLERQTLFPLGEAFSLRVDDPTARCFGVGRIQIFYFIAMPGKHKMQMYDCESLADIKEFMKGTGESYCSGPIFGEKR